MKKSRVKKIPAMLVLAAAMLLFVSPKTVKAAGEKVYFGSEYYEPQSSSTFKVGVYIESAENMGYYEVFLSYDPEKLQYVGGGTTGGEGLVSITETCDDANKKYMLQFKALSPGSTTLKVNGATIYDKATGEATIIHDLPVANIFVDGDKSAVLSELAVCGVEVPGISAETFKYSVDIPYSEMLEVTTQSALTIEPSVKSLEPGENLMTLKVSSAEGSTAYYNLTVNMEEAPVIEEPPMPEPEIEVVESAEETEAAPEKEKKGLLDAKTLILLIVVLLLALLVICAAIVLILVINRTAMLKAKGEQKKAMPRKTEKEYKDFDEE